VAPSFFPGASPVTRLITNRCLFDLGIGISEVTSTSIVMSVRPGPGDVPGPSAPFHSRTRAGNDADNEAVALFLTDLEVRNVLKVLKNTGEIVNDQPVSGGSHDNVPASPLEPLHNLEPAPAGTAAAGYGDADVSHRIADQRHRAGCRRVRTMSPAARWNRLALPIQVLHNHVERVDMIRTSCAALRSDLDPFAAAVRVEHGRPEGRLDRPPIMEWSMSPHVTAEHSRRFQPRSAALRAR